MQVDFFLGLSISLPIISELLFSYIVRMSRQYLEKYAQDHSHHGVNSQELLQKFMEYQAICKDPLLVFRFMEEKAICTFLPAFWLKKAELSCQLGDYSNCFECLELAWCRTEEQEGAILKEIELAREQYRQRMVQDMKQYPLKSKRTIMQFNMNEQNFLCTQENEGKILKMYQQKYGGLRREKETLFEMKRSALPPSWLFELYQKEDEKEKIIEQKIHENSVKISKQVKYHSMHTPVRVRDPQRLTKTMDSVQIMRKKKSTRQKSKKHFKDLTEQIESEPEADMSSQSISRVMASLPVGRKFASMKRRVTFKNDNFNNLKEGQMKQEKTAELPESVEKEGQKMEDESNVSSSIHVKPPSKGEQ